MILLLFLGGLGVKFVTVLEFYNVTVLRMAFPIKDYELGSIPSPFNDVHFFKAFFVATLTPISMI